MRMLIELLHFILVLLRICTICRMAAVARSCSLFTVVIGGGAFLLTLLLPVLITSSLSLSAIDWQMKL
jgi:hypothetical protein